MSETERDARNDAEKAAETAKAGLGRVAFRLSVAAAALGIVIGAWAGKTVAPLYAWQSAHPNTATDPSTLPDGLTSVVLAFAGISLLQLIPTALGIWGFVQGIVAMRSKRGATFGRFAVLIAFVGVMAAYLATSTAAQLSASPDFG